MNAAGPSIHFPSRSIVPVLIKKQQMFVSKLGNVGVNIIGYMNACPRKFSMPLRSTHGQHSAHVLTSPSSGGTPDGNVVMGSKDGAAALKPSKPRPRRICSV